MQAASGITHLLASTFERGQTFHVIRTPSIPSRSVFAVSAIVGSLDQIREFEFFFFLFLLTKKLKNLKNPLAFIFSNSNVKDTKVEKKTKQNKIESQIFLFFFGL